MDLLAALTTPATAKTLELTEEQTKKLTALAEDAQQLHNLLQRERVDDAQRRLARTLRDAADGRMMAVLSETQHKKWQDLIGKPWSGLHKTLPDTPGGEGRSPGP